MPNKFHNTPHVKEYDKNGQLLNEVTKGNPYIVMPRIRKRKTNNRPNSQQFIQTILYKSEKENVRIYAKGVFAKNTTRKLLRHNILQTK